jgi:predicted alpha/beta superfamily hydrolase
VQLRMVVQAAALLLALHWGPESYAAQGHSLAPGTTEELTLTSNTFKNTRTIRVLLPPRYYDPAEKNRKYPVFYFTDGIAVFDGRKLAHIAGQLMLAGEIPPMIFVGMDNGGSTRESQNPGSDRANEYLPFEDKFLEPPLPAPHGRLFPKFLTEEVWPLIENRYRTTNEIGLGGSSYGAEIALYTVMEQPGRYHWLYLESPSLYVHDDELLRRAEAFTKWPQRIYVGAGTAEGAKEDQQEMLDDVKRFARTIEHQTRTCLLIVPGARHEEDAWRVRLPTALKFLLGSGSCNVAQK